MVENPLLKVLLDRKSVRKFKPTQVSREAVEQIVRTGQRAPTACRVEAYSFILVSDLEKRKQIVGATVGHEPTRRFMEEALVWIMICTDFARQIKFLEMQGLKNEFSEVSKFMLGIIDAALAAENMVIAAEALGLGSCFVGSIWTAPKGVAEILNLPENVLPVVLLCIGHPDENPQTRSRWPLEAVLHENEYNMPDERLMLEHASARQNWEVSSPYKLPRNVEQRIRREWREQGFLI